MKTINVGFLDKPESGTVECEVAQYWCFGVILCSVTAQSRHSDTFRQVNLGAPERGLSST